jgi:hypothetical protein
MGTYLCFEVAMPLPLHERVDLLRYDSDGTWRFYELKVSKSDFYSKNKNTFRGHYNYYVLPEQLYVQVKQDIPDIIGVYVVNKYKICRNVKRAKKQDMRINHDELMLVFMQALSREYHKYMYMKGRIDNE